MNGRPRTTKQETLTEYVRTHDGWSYQIDKQGVVILWWQNPGGTEDEPPTETVHVPWDVLYDNELAPIIASVKGGRDVDHITRVTGYFSKVSGWNKAKRQELKDRHRTRGV